LLANAPINKGRLISFILITRSKIFAGIKISDLLIKNMMLDIR